MRRLLSACVVACVMHGIMSTGIQTSDSSASHTTNESSMQAGTYTMDCLAPQSHPCLRSLRDNFIEDSAVQSLKQLPEQSRNIIEQIISKSAKQSDSQPKGPVTILDLVSGATTYQTKFANIYAIMKSTNQSFNQSSVITYCNLIGSIKQTIHETVSPSLNQTINLYLTSPSFFSHITPLEPLSPNDEYYHSHIDLEQYGSFHYTALVYLSTYQQDFEGGEFVFLSNNKSDSHSHSAPIYAEVSATTATEGSQSVNTTASNVTDESHNTSINQMVYPASGRMMWFSSGAENPHLINRIQKGVRQALTVAFTLNEQHSIENQLMERFPFCKGLIG